MREAVLVLDMTQDSIAPEARAVELTNDVVRVDGDFSIGSVIPGLDMPARDAEQGLGP